MPCSPELRGPPVEKLASDVYAEAARSPFLAKFVVFGKRPSLVEGCLLVFCVTDDDADVIRSLRPDDGFVELARSNDVEVSWTLTIISATHSVQYCSLWCIQVLILNVANKKTQN